MNVKWLQAKIKMIIFLYKFNKLYKSAEKNFFFSAFLYFTIEYIFAVPFLKVFNTKGESIPVSMLFIHAQDHIMTAISEKELIKKMILQNKKINELENRIFN